MAQGFALVKKKNWARLAAKSIQAGTHVERLLVRNSRKVNLVSLWWVSSAQSPAAKRENWSLDQRDVWMWENSFRMVLHLLVVIGPGRKMQAVTVKASFLAWKKNKKTCNPEGPEGLFLQRSELQLTAERHLTTAELHADRGNRYGLATPRTETELLLEVKSR